MNASSKPATLSERINLEGIIIRPPQKKRVRHDLSEEELIFLVENIKAQGEQYWIATLLMLGTGCRCSELIEWTKDTFKETEKGAEIHYFSKITKE